MYQSSLFLLLLTIACYIVLVWIEGMGYASIWRFLNREHPTDYGNAMVQKGWDKAQYLILFIPVVRLIPLFNINTKLQQVTVYMAAEEDIKEGFSKIQ